MKRAVFLDRDGVVNRSVVISGVPTPPRSCAEISIIDGVVEAIQILKNHNFIPVIVTNQPDVARRVTTQVEVESMNAFIMEATGIDFCYACFHDDADACGCRKPAPGLIFKAAAELDLDIKSSYLVGDRWRDIAAGQAAGCKNFFIDYSYEEKKPVMPFIGVTSLNDAVMVMLGESIGN